MFLKQTHRKRWRLPLLLPPFLPLHIQVPLIHAHASMICHALIFFKVRGHGKKATFSSLYCVTSGPGVLVLQRRPMRPFCPLLTVITIHRISFDYRHVTWSIVRAWDLRNCLSCHRYPCRGTRCITNYQGDVGVNGAFLVGTSTSRLSNKLGTTEPVKEDTEVLENTCL